MTNPPTFSHVDRNTGRTIVQCVKSNNELLQHRCGHWEEHDLRQSHPIGTLPARIIEKREIKRMQIEQTDCRMCKGLALARHANRELPQLYGSDKAVAYAEKVRARWYRRWRREVKQLTVTGRLPEWHQEAHRRIFETFDVNRWIFQDQNWRDQPLKYLVESAMGGTAYRWPDDDELEGAA